MVKKMVRWQQTPRDAQLMQSLTRCPLTALDLLKLSQTWPLPFSSLRRVQKRCQELAAAGQLRSWRYATTGPGGSSPLYYKLTPTGYRTAVGDNTARPPTKRFLHELNPGRHRHQRALSEFIVHTFTSAHAAGVSVTDFHPENTYCIDCAQRPLFPDATFTLTTPTPFRFFVELDNSTESVWSEKSDDSIRSKMQRYLLYASVNQISFRVLFVLTGASERRRNILEMARHLTIGQPFAMFYVVHLQEYLSASNALCAPCFSSPRDSKIALLRSQQRHLRSLTKTHPAALLRDLVPC